MTIYTLGHSTRSLEEFIEILENFRIELVVDVRRWPTSEKFPWFSKDNLQEELNRKCIQYIHFPQLGGYRKEGYATFSQSEEFAGALKKLLEIIDDKIATILCAERLFWRCHRKYIASCLSNSGHKVIHILDKETVYEHKLGSKDIEEKMKLKIFCDKVGHIKNKLMLF